MKQRDEAIDVLKGMLVFGMILSHVASLISSYSSVALKYMWVFTGLITFPGFVFSFGFACQWAYFGKDFHMSYRRMLATALKLLVAFYISGIYWRAFVDKSLSVETIANILLLNDIPPFSEFLISFSLIILVSLLLFVPIQRITDSSKLFWTTFILLLFTTYIPYEAVDINQLGLLIGTTEFPAFPVLQYFPVYLLGIYFARHRILLSKQTFAISAFGLIAFLAFYLVHHDVPSRFPPSIWWITASIFLVYFYYLIAKQLARWQIATQILGGWGKNVLFYLLISNIIIFTFRGAYEPILLHPSASVGVTLLILLLINFLTTIVAVPKSVPQMHSQKTTVVLEAAVK